MLQLHSFFGPIYFYKRAAALAIPIMIQLFIQALVSLIDNFMVADLGDLKMSGVNIANHIIFVYITGLEIMCRAGGIFMSQYNGSKDQKGMQQAYRFKQLSCMLFTLILFVTCAAIPDTLLGLLVQGNSAKTEIVGQGRIYTGIIIFTFLPVSFSAAIASSLRDIGSVKVSMYISLIATLVNTAANYVLIYGNFGAPRLEVAGAAYATVLARLTELLLFLCYVKKTKPPFYVRLRQLFKINAALFRTILKNSALIFFADMSWVMSETVVTAVYNSRGGPEVVSGMSAGWTIANLFFLVFPAIHTAVGVIVGGTLGRNALGEARLQAQWLKHGAVLLGVAAGMLEGAAVLLIPVVFARLTPEAHTVARMLLVFIACYMPLWCFQNAQYAVARAGGDTAMGAKVDPFVNLVLFMPSIFLLYRFTALSAPVMYALSKSTTIVKAVLAHRQLKKEYWVKNLTV
ncbi:MAG: MATE family efflux transporter [Treponema sp.]